MLVLAQVMMSGCALVPDQVRAVEPLSSRIEQVIASAQDLAAPPPVTDETSLDGEGLTTDLAEHEPARAGVGGPAGGGSIADTSGG